MRAGIGIGIGIGPTLLVGRDGDLTQSSTNGDIQLAAGTTVKAQAPPVTDPTSVQVDLPRSYSADGRRSRTEPISVLYRIGD